MGILKRLTGQMWNQPTLFAVDIPVSRSVKQDKEKGKMTHGTYGPGYETPLAFLDPVSCSWKMYKVMFPLGELPLLKKLPNSGMTVNGVLYQRPAWAPITEGTDLLLWPTPTAVVRPMEGNVRMYRAKVQAGEMTEAEAEAILGKSVWAAHSKIPAMWPTPVASGGLDGGSHLRATMKKLQGTSYEVPSTGKLNPTWVEWLMGFPEGWTDSEA
jgi:hypothetical protein